MPHSAKSVSLSHFKLSKDQLAHRSRADRDEWRAAERAEFRSQIVILTILGALAIAGAVLIAVGLAR